MAPAFDGQWSPSLQCRLCFLLLYRSTARQRLSIKYSSSVNIVCILTSAGRQNNFVATAAERILSLLQIPKDLHHQGQEGLPVPACIRLTARK